MTARRVPDISRAAFIAPTAEIMGDIELAEQTSVWFGAIARADLNAMRVGVCTNIQDGAILHGDPDKPLAIADYVTIGHRAIIHGTEIGRGSLIGMGAIVMEGVRVGAGSIVGAGAVVTKDVPSGVVVAGIPAKVLRTLTPEEIAHNIKHAEMYYALALRHAAGEFTADSHR